MSNLPADLRLILNADPAILAQVRATLLRARAEIRTAAHHIKGTADPTGKLPSTFASEFVDAACPKGQDPRVIAVHSRQNRMTFSLFIHKGDGPNEQGCLINADHWHTDGYDHPRAPAVSTIVRKDRLDLPANPAASPEHSRQRAAYDEAAKDRAIALIDHMLDLLGVAGDPARHLDANAAEMIQARLKLIAAGAQAFIGSAASGATIKAQAPNADTGLRTRYTRTLTLEDIGGDIIEPDTAKLWTADMPPCMTLRVTTDKGEGGSLDYPVIETSVPSVRSDPSDSPIDRLRALAALPQIDATES